MGRGGKREGAGRPSSHLDRRVMIRLSEWEINLLDWARGETPLSTWIREMALSEAKKQLRENCKDEVDKMLSQFSTSPTSPDPTPEVSAARFPRRSARRRR